jgi:hypothetical protein
VGRFGQPEEIAQVVELLVTNSYMTDKVCDLSMLLIHFEIHRRADRHL